MNPHRTAALLAVAVLALAGGGCGSSHTAATTSTVVHSVDPTTRLEHAVRVALAANHRLSGYVLWHNVVPSWATQSTRASALAALRASARDRRSQGIRIRPLADHIKVLDLRISPSYSSATATVRDSGLVVPYRDGRRLGRTIRLDERARVELRRIGEAPRFVVWRVSAVR
jgi:hypothetical protein